MCDRYLVISEDWVTSDEERPDIAISGIKNHKAAHQIVLYLVNSDQIVWYLVISEDIGQTE